MFLIGIFKVPWNYLFLKMISSFVLTQKKQKVKTENSFHAKPTATNLLRDPNRLGKPSFLFHSFVNQLPGLPDRSAGLRTWFIALFCSEKNLRSVLNAHHTRSRDRPYINFVRFQREDSGGGHHKQYRSKGRPVCRSGLYCVRNPICRKQEIFMKP